MSEVQPGEAGICPPLSAREREAVEAMRAAVVIVGDGEEPVPYDIRGLAREVVRLREECARLRGAVQPGEAGIEAAREAIVAVVDDHLQFNVAAYGKAWTGERDDTRFLVADAAQKAIAAYLSADSASALRTVLQYPEARGAAAEVIGTALRRKDATHRGSPKCLNVAADWLDSDEGRAYLVDALASGDGDA